MQRKKSRKQNSDAKVGFKIYKPVYYLRSMDIFGWDGASVHVKILLPGCHGSMYP
jgi:hypothetical protein